MTISSLPFTGGRPARISTRAAYFAFALAAIIGLTFSSLPIAYASASLPSGFAESTVTILGRNSLPTDMAFAPDGRLFVTQKYGALRVIRDGVLLDQPFLSLNVNGANERGLLGVAADPDFVSNGYVYIFYTLATSPVRNRVSRFTADPANHDVALPGSETIITELDPVTTSYHNAGKLAFGPDGKLYVAVGNDTVNDNSQSLSNRLGKILRINRDGSIPTDNPFYATATGDNRQIWAYGLRNPFTFAIQPNTGKLYINDVGEYTWEEINDGVAGANYGWPTCEGVCAPPDSRFADPIYAYQHGNGDAFGRAITGGVFYNPATPTFPAGFVGKYFFADYVNGWIHTFDPATKAVASFAGGIPNLVDLEVGPDGALYYLTIADETWGSFGEGRGDVRKIQFTGIQSPQIGQQPFDQTVVAGTTATFEVRSSGDAPLSYQWQKNGVAIPGASSSVYTTPATTAADDGAQFRCVITNSFGSATSASATLAVNSNQPPAATITAPSDGARYRAGDTIGYAGTAADAEDGSLPASGYTWQVDFHHDTHVHPGFVPATSGATSGSFMIPTTGELSADVWYRIYLTATDSAGGRTTTQRDLVPYTSTITLATNPPGLQVTLDGQPQTGPYSVASVVNMTRSLGVVSPQTLNGVTYVFDSWSDGGGATHNVSAPATNTTYTASYVVAGSANSDAQFVSQSVPTSMVAGQNYSIEVTYKNTGSSTWTSSGDYKLGSQNPQDNFTWGFNRVGVPSSIAPGATATFTFVVTAPATAGTHNLQWRMLREGVAWFGSTTPNVAVTVTSPTNGAQFVSQNVPTSMVAGQNYPVSITLKNIGTNTWTPNANYKLGSQNPQDNFTWGFNRVGVPGSVAPGATVTFNFVVTAPATGGTHNFQWRMLREGVTWFGSTTPNVPVAVNVPPKGATFVSQSVPTRMTAGQRYTVSATMKNVGASTWTFVDLYRLGSQNPPDNFTWGFNRVDVPSSIAPGATATFTFTITAPATRGRYNFQWRMVHENVEWFGDTSPNVAVDVN